MDPILGTVQLFALSFVPTGWITCDGSLIPIMQWQALYSLLGTTFGGDGTTSFALPDLRGKAPLAGNEFAIAVVGVYPQRP